MKTTRCIMAAMVWAIAFSIALASNRQAQSVRTLTADGPRPLASAADELERMYGMLINYEDPPYAYENDYEDKTAPEFWGKGRRFLIPKAGRLEVKYEISDRTQQPENPTTLILALLRDHANRGNPGVFRLDETNGIYYIIPKETRDAKGAMEPVSPIMDTPITLSAVDRILGDAVQEICRTVSQARGSTVLLALMPNNLFLQRHTSRGAAKEAARDVLRGMLSETGRSLIWRLNYDGGTGRYFLNIRGADMEMTDIRGLKVTREIPLPLKK